MHPVALIDCGLIFALAGACVLGKEWWLRRVGEGVPGIVIALLPRGEDSYASVVKFRAVADGGEMQAVTPLWTTSPPRTGSSVRVIYDPANPADVTIDEWLGVSMFLGLLFVALGLAGIAWGVYQAATGKA